MPTQDWSFCAPPGVPEHRYRMTGWYKSDAQPRWVAYYRNASGGWLWWAQSEPLPPAAEYAPATFTTPTLPADATALSFGLSLYSALTVDDFTPVDLGGPWPSPASGTVGGCAALKIPAACAWHAP